MNSESLQSAEKIAAASANSKAGALIIGITNGSEHHTYSFGTVNANNKSKPEENTIFEIASITKVFTAILLTELWKENKLSLNDPVEKYLAPSVVIPQKNGKRITLFQLAAHTSGLPANPSNINSKEKYGVEQFHQFLSNCKLDSLPGQRYSYSNVGYRLLGEAVEGASKQSYEQLLNEKILEPLSLTETKLRIKETDLDRLAVGHDEDGNEMKNAPFSGGAAGGLKSTTKDLYKLLDCILSHKRTTPAAKSGAERIAVDLEEMCKRRFKTSTGESSCIAWLRDDSLDVYGKNGLLNGTSSYIGFSPKRKLGIIVLASSLQMNASAIFRDIYKTLVNSKIRA